MAESNSLKCPFCGSDMVARIIYGRQVHTKELERDLQAGRVILRSGEPGEQDPRYHCLECSIGWGTYPRRRVN